MSDDIQRPGFITGSHVYGIPNAESDVDLVLLLDARTQQILEANSETKKVPIRYGNLNLILCHSPEEYDAWKTFTDQTTQVAVESGIGVSSAEAREIFKKYRIRGGSGKADERE
jgi:hypothetical protein